MTSGFSFYAALTFCCNFSAAKRLWEKEHELNIEEEVAAKAKQFLELHLLEKAHESSDGAIDDYLEQIQELENVNEMRFKRYFVSFMIVLQIILWVFFPQESERNSRPLQTKFG